MTKCFSILLFGILAGSMALADATPSLAPLTVSPARLIDVLIDQAQPVTANAITDQNGFPKVALDVAVNVNACMTAFKDIASVNLSSHKEAGVNQKSIQIFAQNSNDFDFCVGVPSRPLHLEFSPDYDLAQAMFKQLNGKTMIVKTNIILVNQKWTVSDIQVLINQ